MAHANSSGSLLLAALICSFPSRPASAAIFDSDDRQFVSTVPGSPYSPIGLVRRRFPGAYETGTLVDECHVLTSQHIFGDRRSPIGKRLTFTGAVGSKQQVSSGGTVVAAGGLENYRAADQLREARGNDWLLLRLDACLGRILGYAKLHEGPATAFELKSVENAGYPMDRSRRSGLTVDPSCEIRAIHTLVWLHDCATLQGNSGGPIFRLFIVGGMQQLEVFAIESAGIRQIRPIAYVPGWGNWATPVSMIMPNIQKLVSVH